MEVKGACIPVINIILINYINPGINIIITNVNVILINYINPGINIIITNVN